MSTQAIVVERAGATEILTLNRPDARNALDLEIRLQLIDELDRAANDPEVRAIVLTGARGTFCAGGDVTSMRGSTHAEARQRFELLAQVITALRNGPPAVAAIEGFAIGAGLGLALACDHVVAASDATVDVAFTRIGLAVDGGLSVTLPERIGVHAARHLLLRPRRMSGVEAQRRGIVDEVVDAGTTLTAALGCAEEFAAGPALAIAGARRLLDSPEGDFASRLARETDVQTALLQTADLDEGVTALLERRPPTFRDTRMTG